MSLTNLFKTICELAEAEPTRGVKEEEIQEFESKVGFLLPHEVREYFSIMNGLRSETHPLCNLLDLSQIITTYDWYADTIFGLVAINEQNNSNPFYVACKGPLSGCIINASHDGDDILAYHSLQEFFACVIEAWQKPRTIIDYSNDPMMPELLEQISKKLSLDFQASDFEFNPNVPKRDYDELPSPFDSPTISTKDRELSAQVFKTARQHVLKSNQSDWEFQLLLKCELDLLAEDQIDAAAEWLDHDISYVRFSVVDWLRKNPTAAAKRLLMKQQQNEFDCILQSYEFLQKSGIACSLQGGPGNLNLQIDTAEPYSLNFQFLYADRKRPDYHDYLLATVHRLSAHHTKNPS